jgi:protein O-GlcNAc transferase
MSESRRSPSTEVRLQRAAGNAVAGDLSEARRQCTFVLQADPRNAAALHLLGALSSCNGDLKTAEEFLRQAISLEPHRPTWLRDLAVLYEASGDWPATLDAVSQSLAIAPTDVTAISIQARALWELEEPEKALPVFDRWSESDPNQTASWLGSSRCLTALNRLEEAARNAQRALQLEPECVAAHQLLAQIHWRRRQHDQVLRHRLELLRLLPDDSSALGLAAMAYYETGDVETAVALFRSARCVGISAGLHAAYLPVLLHSPQSTAELLINEHREWARCHAAAQSAEPAFSKPLFAGRTLHIAYLCTEPANSPVFRYFPAFLRNHDRGKFEVSLYCKDASLRGRSEQAGVEETELKDIAGWGARRIAEKMRRDHVDILISFSGHFGGGSLMVAAMRGAPIQVSYPSYPCTTGIPEMDYIFTDRWTCPPGQEIQYTERPYWLASGYLVYEVAESIPFASQLPALQTGAVTFGIFQRPAKLNTRLWDAIAEILKQVTNSKLLIHFASLDLDSNCSMSRLRLVAELEARGIDPARVNFRGLLQQSDHLDLISTVDIALDSFPYTGQTTTCECLWMGVPVVTLAGNIHVSRASAAILSRVGLEDLVAHDFEDYIRIAVRTASDIPALAALRKGLRQRVQASTLVDGARLAREVEEAYRWMWEQWMGTMEKESI